MRKRNHNTLSIENGIATILLGNVRIYSLSECFLIENINLQIIQIALEKNTLPLLELKLELRKLTRIRAKRRTKPSKMIILQQQQTWRDFLRLELRELSSKLK